MVRVRLETSREHVAELARLRDPVGAVEELVRNALDADCGRVVVILERNDLGGVDRVRIQDDGYGMSAEECEEYFRPIGSSWKRPRRARRSGTVRCTARAARQERTGPGTRVRPGRLRPLGQCERDDTGRATTCHRGQQAFHGRVRHR
ncbi:ATP-binding protein [Streptomyces parvulus]|uniref:ATP-binding protein n=1 Tax=Streptomyces parvulus TaxID=146923 RepID=UPI0036F6CADA